MSEQRAPVDTEPLSADMPRPPHAAEPVVVPRWMQLVLLPLAVIALWAIASAAGPVLLVFIVAAVIALILNPLVKVLHRGRVPRGLAVFAVYLALLLSAAVVTILLANPVAGQVENFAADVPQLVDDAEAALDSVQRWVDERGIDVQVKQPGRTALGTLQDNVVQSSSDVVSFTRDLLQALVEASFALILVLVISIYMLLYGDRIGALVRSVMPPGDGTPEDDFPTRAQKAVFGYVRGQLAFSLIMGASAGLALWVVGALGIFPDGKTYALFFGAFFGLMELVPYVGPVLGALPPIAVALFQDPLMAVWVTLLFVALQQLEGHVVAPQVFGHTLRINPLLVIFALLLGAQLYGIVGALVALPLAAVGKETVLYLQRHVVLEPWGTPSAAAIAAGDGTATPAPESDRCRECGAARGEGDAFCRSCGTAAREAEPAIER